MQSYALGIFGITGRMGQAIVHACEKEPSPFRVIGGTSRHGPIASGHDRSLDVLATAADVLLDFSDAEALSGNLEAALIAKKPLVVCTTALTPDHHKKIDAAALHIPVLQTSNTSVGVAVLIRLLEQASSCLGASDTPDVDIGEMHHRHKKDAPSGTAHMLAEAWRAGKGLTGPIPWFQAMTSGGSRKPGEIGLQVQRAGERSSSHTVTLNWGRERLSFEHVAFDETIFAHGALKAALWLVTRPPGRYAMRHVVESAFSPNNIKAL